MHAFARLLALHLAFALAWPGLAQTAATLPQRLEADVRRLVVDFHPRDHTHPENLDRAAAFLGERLKASGGRVSEQVFDWKGRTYRNVRARFGPESGELLVVGAHYDAVPTTPGADDNASGVAGLLELARRLGEAPPKSPVELVAYTLEENGLVGSAEHARSLKVEGRRVRAMLSLEMLGCFKDTPGSQRYPISLLKAIYPSKGNFIVVVGKFGQWGLVRRVRRAMAKGIDLKVRGFVGPPSKVPDLRRSDHASFWKEGFPAVMVTDTANLRNTAYHRPEDTPESLDYARMAEVVKGVEVAVRSLAK